MNILKGTKLYSILTGSCPVCHSDNMYLTSNPYHINTVLKMHERCKICKTKYKIEPSFFFGAMYVSYGVGLVFAGSAFVVAYLIFKLSILTSYGIIVFIMVLALPIILRLSRNIWINIFMSYDKNSVKKV
ncbi:DUF983 domain-containing protein [Maribacter sp. 2210JD10-5]|uniref:DUF983 domain-containing protein n=1 Tax=Maribacter sp. 2210JD10-5 TaxID=3386272 RepID=UPI0039BD4A82